MGDALLFTLPRPTAASHSFYISFPEAAQYVSHKLYLFGYYLEEIIPALFEAPKRSPPIRTQDIYFPDHVSETPTNAPTRPWDLPSEPTDHHGEHNLNSSPPSPPDPVYNHSDYEPFVTSGEIIFPTPNEQTKRDTDSSSDSFSMKVRSFNLLIIGT